MPDRWQTFPVQFAGGLITNLSPLQQGLQVAGSATVLRNFEPSVDGGYRRVEGYTKWDDAQLAGSGFVRGVVEFEQGAIAARGTHLYRSGGSGWTQLTDNATYSSAGVNLSGSGKVRFTKHHFGSNDVLIIVDGDDKPYKWDGSTFAQITTATGDQDGAQHVANHKNHLFFGKDTTLSFSAPFSDTDFTAASGAGTIVFDNAITGLITFREQLIIFTEKTIHLLAGNTIADFQVQPITKDIGAVQPDTVQEIGGDIMFLGPDGLRLLSATERNNDFGLAVVSKMIQPTMTQFVGQSTSYSSVVIREKSQYRLLGFNASYTDESARGILGTQFAQQGGELMQWAETRGINAYVASSSLNGTTEYILFANDDGYVYQMESGNSFDGKNIVASFKTPELPISDPATRKNMYKMKLFVDPQGGFTATMSTEFDYNQVGTSFSTVSTAGGKITMGTGYVRNDTGNNIADGNVINASDLDGEFDAVQAAFNASTGHSHDGTTGEGPQIETPGLADDAVTGAKIDSTTTITAASFVGPLTGNVGGNVTGNVTGDLTGNADTATALETARTIAGQSFDGTANISIAPGDLTGVTASAAEINKLDGATVTTAEINKLDGFTGVVADLNYAKDLRATGVTTTEFDKLDGLTATTTELNKLDGVTATRSQVTPPTPSAIRGHPAERQHSP